MSSTPDDAQSRIATNQVLAGASGVQAAALLGQITSTNIADDAITTPKIAANAVTSAEIAAGAIVAEKITAGEITAEKLTIGLLQDSVLFNASFEELDENDATLPAKWERNSGGGGSVLATTAQSKSGLRSVIARAGPAGWAAPATFDLIPVVAGESWYASGWARSDVTTTGGGYLEIACYDANAAYVSSVYAVSNFGSTTTWVKREGRVTIPAGTFYARVWLYNFQPNVQSDLYWDDITFQRSINPALLSFEALASLFIYGDGFDGDVTVAADTTLTRDMIYNNLTVNAGVVLTTNGYRIFVKNTLTVNGTIRHNGSNAPGGGSQAGGAGAPAGSMGAGGAGGAGSGGGLPGNNPGFGAPAINNGFGGVGGTGGHGSNLATATSQANGANNITKATRHGLQLLSDTAEIRGGRGGGGGGSSNGGVNSAGGGGSGGGGGTIIIAAKVIVIGAAGVIQAKGGNGAQGQIDNVNGQYGGGGAGGGGGAIVLVYRTLTNNGTLDVTGGAGGAGGGLDATAGSAGGAGNVILLQQEA